MVANSRDLLAGLFFMAVGAIVMAFARDYGLGSLAHVGPGFFPMVLAIAMMLLGAAIAILSLRDRRTHRIALSWRPLVVVTAAVFLFAFGLETLGLFLSVAVLVAVSRLARAGETWMETAALALASAAVAAFLFGYALGLPVPLWPALAG